MKKKVFRIEKALDSIEEHVFIADAKRKSIGLNDLASQIFAEIQLIKRMISKQENLIEEQAFINRHTMDTDNEAYESGKPVAIEKEVFETTIDELGLIYHACKEGNSVRKAFDELNSITEGTEVATSKILAESEEIGSLIDTISDKLGEKDQDLIDKIHQSLTQIYEASNFQDLTGQRIMRVQNALHFVEEHLASLVKLWGGSSEFAQRMKEIDNLSAEEEDLLYGPRREGDKGHVDQDDIDALFL